MATCPLFSPRADEPNSSAKGHFRTKSKPVPRIGNGYGNWVKPTPLLKLLRSNRKPQSGRTAGVGSGTAEIRTQIPSYFQQTGDVVTTVDAQTDALAYIGQLLQSVLDGDKGTAGHAGEVLAVLMAIFILLGERRPQYFPPAPPAKRALWEEDLGSPS